MNLTKENLDSPLCDIILESKELSRTTHGGMLIVEVIHKQRGKFTYIQAGSDDVIVIQSKEDEFFAYADNMEEPGISNIP